MACAWLIRKVVDTSAEFVFIPVGAPLPAQAEPFDIPGARLSHHRGLCSFQVLLDEYKLDDPILKRIGRIVQEADVVQEATVEVAAPGLDLICRGIRRTSSDDQIALDRGALIYEALYAELALQAA